MLMAQQRGAGKGTGGSGRSQWTWQLTAKCLLCGAVASPFAGEGALTGTVSMGVSKKAGTAATVSCPGQKAQSLGLHLPTTALTRKGKMIGAVFGKASERIPLLPL